MYGIGENLDFSFLENRELIQIAIGQFQVQFHFDGDIEIVVENSFVYYTCDEQTIWRPEEVSASAAVLKLIGKCVSKVDVEAPTSLWLQFENGDRLAIVGGSSEYESFTVSRPGQTFVV